MEKEKKISSIFKKEVENDNVEIHSIINTPFNVLLHKNTKIWNIIIGNNIVSRKEFSSKEKAYNYINEKPWELITNIIFLSIEQFKKLNNKKND